MIEAISFTRNHEQAAKIAPDYDEQRKLLEARIKRSIHKLIDLQHNESPTRDFWNVKWSVTQRVHQISNEILMRHNAN